MSLALSPTGVEVAGNDYVDLEGARTVFAGIVADTTGGSLELAGDLKGYAIDAAGGRQYLLVQPDGLDWYRAASAPVTHVALSAAVQGGSFALSGSVQGLSGTPAAGTVELWRETAAGAGAADHSPPRRRRNVLVPSTRRPCGRSSTARCTSTRPPVSRSRRSSGPFSAAEALIHRLHRVLWKC